jgi:uncharacterized protein YjbI with pentapeptide repeats
VGLDSHRRPPAGPRRERASGGGQGVLRLSGQRFREADLTDADLRECDLTGPDLDHAHLQGAKLRGSDLRGASLDAVDGRALDVHGARLDLPPSVQFARAHGALVSD